MKVLISGSHGLVGRALVRLLANEGHEVTRLVRRDRKVGSAEVEWDPNQGLIVSEHLEGFDAVIHLAGESIASGRWTEQKKRAIRDSRIKGTQLLTRSLMQLSHPPSSFMSASAIGYYGNRGDELLTEDSAPGTDFLADVCVEWEKAVDVVLEKGIRTVVMRFGIILDQHGGALAKMLTPFRMGIGGQVGDGTQWMSWIALDDVVNALRFVLDDTSIRGPVNFVAPEPVTNEEFTKALGKALSRPTIFPVPGFAARLAFGEMADALLLSSQRVAPSVLTSKGYHFSYPTLKSALDHILSRR